MISIGELLAKAEAKGLNDREIARITGRNSATVWRWRRKPDAAYVCDEGIQALVRRLEEG